MRVPTSISLRLHPFLRVLDETGARYAEQAAKSGLPGEVIYRTDKRYSLPIAYRFLEDIELSEGIDDLALRGASCENYESIEPTIRNRLASSCTTLVALVRYAEIVRQYNGRRTALSDQGDRVWFLAQTEKKVARESWNRFSDWSNLIIPIEVLRIALGKNWCPPNIALQTSTPITELAEEKFPHSRIQTGAPATGFTIPKKLLSWRMPDARVPEPTGTHRKHGPISFAQTVTELVDPYLPEPCISVDFLAEATFMSPRTLQRRLAENGTSFRDVIASARFSKATRLLEDRSAKIIDVALELGFEDPSHFSRAFRKIAGQSPREYRRGLF